MNLEKISSLGQSIEAHKQHMIDYEVTHAEKSSKVSRVVMPSFMALCAATSLYHYGADISAAVSTTVATIGAFVIYVFASKSVKNIKLNDTYANTIKDLDELSHKYEVLSKNILNLKNKQEASNIIARQLYTLEDFISPESSFYLDNISNKIKSSKAFAKEQVFSKCEPESPSYLLRGDGSVDIEEVKRYTKAAYYQDIFISEMQETGLSGVLKAMSFLKMHNIESSENRYKKLDALWTHLDKSAAIEMLEIYKSYRTPEDYNRLLAYASTHFDTSEPADDKPYSFIYQHIDRLSAESKAEFLNIVEVILPQLAEISKNLTLLKDNTSITDNIERTKVQIEEKIQGFISSIEADLEKDTRILKKMTTHKA